MKKFTRTVMRTLMMTNTTAIDRERLVPSIKVQNATKRLTRTVRKIRSIDPGDTLTLARRRVPPLLALPVCRVPTDTPTLLMIGPVRWTKA